MLESVIGPEVLTPHSTWIFRVDYSLSECAVSFDLLPRHVNVSCCGRPCGVPYGCSDEDVVLEYRMQPRANEQAWGACREAYALGDSLRHASSRLGLNYETVKKRAQRQRWPSPAMLTKAKPSPCLSGADIAAETWAARGELHRLTVWEGV
jgi:hypothetical protein